jgi:hypothetical protein
MSLKINPQYVRQAGRTVSLTLHPCFVSKHSYVQSDNVLIHNFTTRGIVFSIIHDDGEMTVFCCAVQISIPPINGQIQIEIRSSETQMKYFTEDLSSRLPCLTSHLDNQCMFDDDIQANLLRENNNDVDVIELTENLFMVMFDQTIYFFRIDFEYEVFGFKLSLWKLNQTTYMDSDQGIRDLSRRFDSFRFFTDLVVYDDHVDFNVYSDVFNQRNSCVRASVTIHFDDYDDTLETSVDCSRRLIRRGVDYSPFSSITEPDSEETGFSNKTLRILDEDSEEESDEEDSDEEDPILFVESDDGTNRYVFRRGLYDDDDFFCIICMNGIVYLLQVEHENLPKLNPSISSAELIERFEIDFVDFSERLEGFGEVVGSCLIDIADPIKITCDFHNKSGNRVLTEKLTIENDELVRTILPDLL